MRNLLLALFISLLVGNAAKAQRINSFSRESDKFLVEADAFVNASKRNDYKAFFDVFTKSWKTVYDEEQRQKIIGIFNSMNAKKMTAFPYFGNYLEALNTYSKSGQVNNTFDEWHSVLDSMAQKSNRLFDQILKSSQDLFENRIIYQSQSTKWRIVGDNYSMKVLNGQPVVVFTQSDLVCNYFTDSIYIQDTRGYVDLLEQRWFGNKGKIDWSRCDFPSDSIFVRLDKYEINLKESGFSADTVEFFNANLGKKSILGAFTDKCAANVKPENAKYPRFLAFDKAIAIPNIFEDIDYYGNFSIEGFRYYALAGVDFDAKISIRRKGEVVFNAISKRFSITRNSLLAESTIASIYLLKDSIFHPGLSMKFNDTERKLTLFMENSAINRSAFTNSYHSMDVFCDAITWKIDEPILEFKMTQGLSEATAVFSSVNYFSMADFRALQGITSFHPLVRLKAYSDRIQSPIFGIDGFAAFMNLSIEAIRGLLFEYASQGFLLYNRAKEEITLKEKTFTFINASANKIDYDIIKIVSKTTRESNGELNLNTLDLNIKGVPVILLSDSHQVFIAPRGNAIKVQKDRNLSFEGRLHAGPLDFFGTGFTFDYKTFQVNLKNVDSLRFKVWSGQVREDGRRIMIDLKTVMENITGVLYLDEPNNKSGKRPTKQYPIFKSFSESFVYFNKPEILDGVYTRDKFWFKVKPFTLDSLDFVTSKQGLNFPGTLTSAKIFPDFQEILTIQPDTSLGFVRKTSVDGFPTYGGKGKFYNQIILNNTGLQGNGKIIFASSTSLSKQFVFYPDSMNTYVDSFYVARGNYQGAVFPSVRARDAYNHWMPYRDTMQIFTRREPIKIFDERTKFKGEYVYTPIGSSGNGIIMYDSEELVAKNFKFTEQRAESDASTLRIGSIDPSILAFSTEDVSSRVDFSAKKGEFHAKNATTKVDLTYNKYEAHLKEFYWDLDKKMVHMGSQAKGAEATTRFISKNENQENFEFNASYGLFNLTDYKLDAFGVKEIPVADAYINPDSAKLTIGKDARLDPLKNAVVILDTINKFHRIYNATVQVESKKKFSGSGEYDYTNRTGIVQKIKFDVIRTDETGKSVASGNVSSENKFVINPGFSFRGGTSITGSQKEVRFKGFCSLTDLPRELNTQDFKIDALADPKKDYFPIKNITDNAGKPLVSGFAYSNVVGVIYPLIIDNKSNETDSMIFLVDGVIQYDQAKNIYRIGDEKKVIEGAPQGSMMVINGAEKRIYGEGKLNLLFNAPKIGFTTYGKVNYPYDKKVFSGELVALINMAIPSDLLKMMTQQFFDLGYNWSDTKNDKDIVKGAIYSALGPEKSAKVIEELTLYSTIPTGGDLKQTFIMPGFKFQYYPDFKAFRSTSDLGLANVENEQVNKNIPGMFEILDQPDGGTLNMLFEVSNQNYYLLSYKAGNIQLISSEMDFNNEVLKKIAKKKKKKGDASNEISLGSTETRDLIIGRGK